MRLISAIAMLASLQAAALAAPTPAPSPSPSASASALAPASTGAPSGTLLPGGTAVVVSLLEPISSATAHENDQLGIVAKKEIRVNGVVLVAAGATGHATVTSVEGSAGNGSGGKLAISIDWINAVDGGKVKLTQTNHASESGDSKGAASTVTLLSWALLGPIGFFAHNFVHGRDVTIDTKRTFTVFTDHDVYVGNAVTPAATDSDAPR